MSRNIVMGVTVGEKLKQARLSQKPRPTQKQVGDFLGVTEKKYQAIELDRSESGAREAVDRLSLKWRINPDWFWNEKPSKIPGSPDDSSKKEDNKIEALVDVRLYVPSVTGKAIMNPITAQRTKIEAGLSINDTYVVKVGTNDNSPRVKAGRRLIIEPRTWPEEGRFSWIRHRTQIELIDGVSLSVCYAREYAQENGNEVYRPVNRKEPTFKASEVECIGIVKGIITIYAEGWSSTERNDEGIPVSPPTISS